MQVERVRLLVNQALEAIVAGERADRVLARTLRANRDLSSGERAHVAEWTLGISLWRGRLDWFAEGRRDLWLGLFLVDREKRPISQAAALSGNSEHEIEDALRRAAPAEPAARLSVERSLPHWLARRWSEQFGASRADALAAAMNERGPISIRVNTHRISRAELIEQLSEEGVRAHSSSLCSTALRFEGKPNIVALEAWRAGLFEVQDEGSQLIAQAVGAQPGETIIDLCAGAGGKTLALAAAMANRGRLLAVDVDPQRLVDLDVRARRAGFTCIERYAGDAREVPLPSDLRPDAVLVDAPCSSLGTLRRGPDARWRLAIDEPIHWVPMQAALLQRAFELVRPGGRVVYATCSVDFAENEGVSRAVAHPQFRLRCEQRTWPDLHDCDGFYWAVWDSENAS